MSEKTANAGFLIGTALGGLGAGQIGSAIGSMFGGSGQSSTKAYNQAREAMWLNIEGQEHVSKNQIPWLVEGANKAGIHPLAAIGVNPASGPSVSVAYPDKRSGRSTFAEMGQNVARAAEAYGTPESRAQTQTMNGLALERAALENELLRSQISSINRPTTPGIGTSRSGQADAVKIASEIVANSGEPNRQAGQITNHQYGAPGRFGIPLVPSEQMKERMDDDLIGSVIWHLTNRVIAPKAPPGHFWNPLSQHYVPIPSSKKAKGYYKSYSNYK